MNKEEWKEVFKSINSHRLIIEYLEAVKKNPNKEFIVIEGKYKILKSENFNYVMDLETGYTLTWGKSLKEDPDVCEVGPLIADIEVTTICKGVKSKPCLFCYKANTPNGINMSFDKFKEIFDKLPKSLTQIAFGADAQCESNPEIWKMMEYCRANNVVPNITSAEISDEVADKFKKYCGAVSISRYEDKDVCYDSVKKLTDRGMNQINIHQMLSFETYEQTLETINDIKLDERLSKLNAIVFLSLKKKGRGKTYSSLTQEQFSNIIKLCFENNIKFGFDSCSASKVLKSVEGTEKFNEIYSYVEPCESCCMSIYFSTEGKFYPCSFCEDEVEGVDISNVTDFYKDIWFGDVANKFRNKLISNKDRNGCRCCPVYTI